MTKQTKQAKAIITIGDYEAFNQLPAATTIRTEQLNDQLGRPSTYSSYMNVLRYNIYNTGSLQWLLIHAPYMTYRLHQTMNLALLHNISIKLIMPNESTQIFPAPKHPKDFTSKNAIDRFCQHQYNYWTQTRINEQHKNQLTSITIKTANNTERTLYSVISQLLNPKQEFVYQIQSTIQKIIETMLQLGHEYDDIKILQQLPSSPDSTPESIQRYLDFNQLWCNLYNIEQQTNTRPEQDGVDFLHYNGTISQPYVIKRVEGFVEYDKHNSPSYSTKWNRVPQVIAPDYTATYTILYYLYHGIMPTVKDVNTNLYVELAI